VKLKILLYEDEPIIALDLYMQLTAQGYEVFMATDPAQACMLCAMHQPDLAILNLHHTANPAEKNLEESLRNIYPLKIIYISGVRADETRETAVLEKAEGILHKPFVASQLKHFLCKNFLAPLQPSA
jgi:DNA-binding response OmpR family regulator